MFDILSIIHLYDKWFYNKYVPIWVTRSVESPNRNQLTFFKQSMKCVSLCLNVSCMFFRDPLKYNGWNSAVTLCHLIRGWLLFAWCLEGGQKQVRKGVHLYMCFLVPLSCPLVLCNHIQAMWQPEVSVINRVHVTRTRQQLEQVVCAWLSVPCHISALSKNHWHVPSNSKNV